MSHKAGRTGVERLHLTILSWKRIFSNRNGSCGFTGEKWAVRILSNLDWTPRGEFETYWSRNLANSFIPGVSAVKLPRLLSLSLIFVLVLSASAQAQWWKPS